MSRILIAMLLPAYAAQSQSKEPQGATVEGTVLDARTGRPLPKARVSARLESSGEARASLTDAEGRFSFRDLTPGSYDFTAECDGYVRQPYGQKRPSHPGLPLTLGPRERLRDVSFRLQPMGVIAGRVTGEDGRPLAEALVDVFRFARREDKRRAPSFHRYASTNDLGEYRIYGLPPGSYYITVKYLDSIHRVGNPEPVSPPEAGRQTVETGYAVTWYPGVTDPAGALPLELRAGEELVRVDLRLDPVRVVRIRGSLAGCPSGSHFWLELRSPRQPFRRPQHYPMTTRRDGTYEIRYVTPGAYALAAWCEAGDDVVSAIVPIDVAEADLEGLEIPLSVGAEVRGRLRRLAAEGAQSPKPLEVRLRPADEVTGAFCYGVVGADGRFVIRRVPPGSYRVEIEDLQLECYLKSAKLGELDVLETGLSVTGESNIDDLDLVAGRVAGIEGIVLDDRARAVAGAVVVLAHQDLKLRSAERGALAFADQHGRFRVPALIPGECKLFAWDDFDPDEHWKPETFAPYEDRGSTVVLKDGETRTVQLRAIRTP